MRAFDAWGLSALVVLGCASRSDQSFSDLGTVKAGLETSVPNADAGAPDGGTPEVPTRVILTLPSAPTPVEALLFRSGAAAIEAYPSLLSTRPRLLSRPLGGGPDDATCASVESLVQRVERGGALAPLSRQRLRGSLEYDVNIPFARDLLVLLPREVGRLALEAGIEGGLLGIDNPLELTDMRVSLVPAAGAWISRVGDVAELEAQVNADLDGQWYSALGFGEFRTLITARDLMCDLLGRRVTLVVRFRGFAGDRSYVGSATSTGLEVP